MCPLPADEVSSEGKLILLIAASLRPGCENGAKLDMSVKPVAR
jgi:hypothetical protein